MRALLGATLFLALLAPACGSDRANVGDSCEQAADCVTDWCVVACSDPCVAAGKDSGVTCGPKYCALQSAPESSPTSQFPCYGGK
jgi:hypothetical protein